MANWIQGAIKHKGALHRELGVPEGEKIPAKKLEAAAKEKGVEGRRARLAETLKGLAKHKKSRREMISAAADHFDDTDHGQQHHG